MTLPHRLISLSPNLSMILFALQADDYVVARTHYCLQSIRQYLDLWGIPVSTVVDRLKHWEDLPVAGVWPQAHPEQIKALNPDYVLMSSTSELSAYDAETFDLPRDKLINFDTRTLADLSTHIHRIGALIGKTTAAEYIIAQLDAIRDAILTQRPNQPMSPRVIFEYCVCIKYDPDPERRFANPSRYVMAGGHLAPELIRLSGGEPLFTQSGDTVKWISLDEIDAAQPDMVLYYDCNGCPNAAKHPIEARRGWSALPAIAHDAAYRLQANISNPNLCYPAALRHLVDIFNQHANRPA